MRLLKLRENKKQAEHILLSSTHVDVYLDFEDNLDKVKAFHETGLWEQTTCLLDMMKGGVEHDVFTGKILAEYLEQGSIERKSIRYSPNELTVMASSHYENKRYQFAYSLLEQAAKLSPDNISITTSLLKVLAILATQKILTDEEYRSITNCLETLKGITLTKG